MRHRRRRVIRCLPALSEWPLNGPRLSGPHGLLRAFASLAPLLAAALAFGVQVADPLRDGGLPWLLRRWLVLQQATRFEAELLRQANISGRKPATPCCFRPCFVQRHLLGHRRTRTEFKRK